MADDEAAGVVAGIEHRSEAPDVGPQLRGMRAAHLSEGLRFEDPSARGFAIRPYRMRLNEAGQVGGRSIERGRGERSEAIVNRRRSIDVVEFRDVRNGRAIHAIGRSRHAERYEHSAPHIVVEGLSGDFLDDQLQQRIAAPRVFEGAARCPVGASITHHRLT